MTDGQRYRFRRNVVIAVAYDAGVSARVLGDVFGLCVTRVKAIARAMLTTESGERRKPRAKRANGVAPARTAENWRASGQG